MNKKKTLLCSALSALTIGSCLMAFGANAKVLTNASSCQHVGNHYAENAATKLESGNAEYYICCKCHKVFKQSEEPSGTWTDATEKAVVDVSHEAYTEPTVTAEDVSTLMAGLGDSLDINYAGVGLSKAKYDNAKQYLDTYLSKEGTSEDDITGLENYHGLKNSLDLFDMNLLETAAGYKESRNKVYAPNPDTIAYNLTDETVGINYARVTATATKASAYASNVFIFGKTLIDATSDVQFMLRTNRDTSLFVYLKNANLTNDRVNQTKLEVKANTWTTVVISYETIQILKEYYDTVASPTYNLMYISDNTATTEGTTYDVSDFYKVNDFSSYKTLSNEGYAYPGYDTQLTITNSTDLKQYYPTFNFLNNATNRNDNNMRSVKFAYKADTLWKGSYLAGIYFGIGNTTWSDRSDTSEVAVVLHSNEEFDIQCSECNGVIYSKTSTKNILEETKVYKGWNVLHFNSDAVNTLKKGSSFHLLTIVPTTWTENLVVEVASLLYK